MKKTARKGPKRTGPSARPLLPLLLTVNYFHPRASITSPHSPMG